jgi:hypothetical protein
MVAAAIIDGFLAADSTSQSAQVFCLAGTWCRLAADERQQVFNVQKQYSHI